MKEKMTIGYIDGREGNRKKWKWKKDKKKWL